MHDLDPLTATHSALLLGRARRIVEGAQDRVRERLVEFATVFAVPRDPEPEVLRGSFVTWALGAGLAALVSLGVAFSDFHINVGKLTGVLALLSIVAIGCRLARTRMRLQCPPALIEAYAQISFISLFAALLSYQLGSLGVPWGDPVLASMDRMLGFDWLAVNRFVADHDGLARVLRFAYQSFIWQPIVVIGMLAFRMSHRRLQQFLLAWTVGLALTLVGLLVAPAQTAYIHYGAAHDHLPDLAQQVGRLQASALEALRTGGLRQLLDQDLEGIVAFPSFHTAGAILYTWALWSVRWMRAPAIALNVTMLAAVPVIGAHYLVDLIAGVLVAVSALAIAVRCARPQSGSSNAIAGFSDN